MTMTLPPLQSIAAGLAILVCLGAGCTSPRRERSGSNHPCTARFCALREAEGERTGKEASLPTPETKQDRAYLGLPENQATFALADVTADTLIVDLFDFYCHVCQKTAPRVNALYGLLQSKGYGAKIRMIGVGVGDSPLEVRTFRNKFRVPFPVFPDPAKAVSGQLGVDKRPSLVVLKRNQGRFEPVFSHTGTFDDVEATLDKVRRAAGL